MPPSKRAVEQVAGDAGSQQNTRSVASRRVSGAGPEAVVSPPPAPRSSSTGINDSGSGANTLGTSTTPEARIATATTTTAARSSTRSTASLFPDREGLPWDLRPVGKLSVQAPIEVRGEVSGAIRIQFTVDTFLTDLYRQDQWYLELKDVDDTEAGEFVVL